MSVKDILSKDKRKESGMVAIMVTIVLMLVISLIVLGFAQISRRNQRQALDRQLSTQAFYAAETGVNDVAKIIKTATEQGQAIATKPDCASTGGGFYNGLVPVLDAADRVEYTCLMVDPTPSTLEYSSVGKTGTIVPLIASSGTIAKLSFTWQSKGGSATPQNNCPVAKADVFSATSAWNCGYGVLRIDLVPTAGALTASGLQAATMTTFVVPLSAGASDAATTGYVAGAGKSLWGRVCTATGCAFAIDGLTQSQYYVRVSSQYKDVSLQIAVTDASNNPVPVQGAQAVIDSTGKAQDVLRRIQVRVPLTGSSSNRLSDFAIQSTEAICKRFSVMDGFFQSDANNAVSGVGASTTNPLCQ